MQELKAIYRKKFKEKLEQIQNSKNLYALESKLTKRLKYAIDSATSVKKRHYFILFYYPLSIEYNCKKLLNHYKKKKNITILLPFMHDISFKIVKYRLPMQKGRFGVYEPRNSFFSIKQLDLAIIPIIGTDRTLRRIGFGKGMYDRFFSAVKTKPKIIFITRALNLAHENITEYFDLQANICLTPFKSLIFKDKNYDNMDYYKFRTISGDCRGRKLFNYKKNHKSK